MSSCGPILGFLSGGETDHRLTPSVASLARLAQFVPVAGSPETQPAQHLALHALSACVFDADRVSLRLFRTALTDPSSRLPAVFSKVAFSLSPQKIKELWIVPLGFVVVTGTSMAVAWAMGTVFRLKKSQKAFAMAASGFMNSNSLPIALMQSLVVEVPGLKVRDALQSCPRGGRRRLARA